jgi:predicted ATPase/DNA-binding CsgD family transcriptional regulator
MHGFTAPLTTFVGRASEVADVVGLLGANRMVTVAGMGGVGKTRFAGEVAREVAGRYADGAWLVELGAVQDAALVPATVAAAMGLPAAPSLSPVESLCAALARRQLLLVLDNCEHLLGAAAGLCRALLPAADDLRVLATSREPLRVAGEARYRLQPFAVAGPGTTERDMACSDATGSDAVTLFADRARLADPHFCLDDRAAPLVARIVARLDGIPLAIELAAARIESLGLDHLAARLDDSRWMLASSDRAAAARHQSLEATVDWSYRLLGQTEQQVFRRLAVLPGPFTLDGAVAVAGADAGPAVLHLVECSLLAAPQTSPDGRARYAMLETLRAFGRDRLADTGEEHAAASGMARHALAVADAAAAASRSSTSELAACRWLDAEDASLSQALAWSLEHDHAAALRLANALTYWRNIRGRSAEAYAQLNAAATHAAPGTAAWREAQYFLAQAGAKRSQAAALAHYRAASCGPGAEPPSVTVALALAGEANTLNLLGRHDEGAAIAARALTLAREIADPNAEVFALLCLSQACQLADDLDGAVDWAREAGRIDPASIPGDFARDCWTMLAVALTETGDLDAARDTSSTLLALARQAGDLTSEAVGRYLLADVELRAGNLAGAWQELRSAVRMALDIQHRIQLVVCLPIGAQLCAAAGRWADVVTIYAARREAGKDIAESPPAVARHEELTRRAASELAPGELRRAEARGAAMALDTAGEFLLVVAAEPGQRAERAAGAPAGHELSQREQELVALVARGRTDAQIAGDLHISVSTVRSHLDRIRDKTSCRRRADLTRLALQAGLA